jgi:hypothetical protein
MADAAGAPRLDTRLPQGALAIDDLSAELLDDEWRLSGAVAAQGRDYRVEIVTERRRVRSGVAVFALELAAVDPDIDTSQIIGKAIGGVVLSLPPWNWTDEMLTEEEETIAFAPGSAEIPSGAPPLLAWGGSALAASATPAMQLCGRHLRGRLGRETGRGRRSAAVARGNRSRAGPRRRAGARAPRLSGRAHGVAADRIGRRQSRYEAEGADPPRAVFVIAKPG